MEKRLWLEFYHNLDIVSFYFVKWKLLSHPSAIFCEFCGKPTHVFLLRFSANSAGNPPMYSFCVLLRILRATNYCHPSAIFCEFCGQPTTAILLRSSANSAGNQPPGNTSVKFHEICRQFSQSLMYICPSHGTCKEITNTVSGHDALFGTVHDDSGTHGVRYAR